MIKLITILVAALVATSSIAEPILFELNDCDVIVVDKTPTANWYLCVTDGHNVGLHNDSEIVECSVRVEIVYNEIMNLDEYIDDCELSTDSEKTKFEQIKLLYR